eukprot:3399023-Pyramimonas_sp.AAC.1
MRSVPGRNLGYNILELDVSSRALSVAPAGSSDIPVLCALDFGQAFPSLNQDFLSSSPSGPWLFPTRSSSSCPASTR